MTSRRYATVTIDTHFDVFQEAVAWAAVAFTEIAPEIKASAAAAAERCDLCWKPAEQLVRVLEDGDVELGSLRRICPDCATERPINLLPAYGEPDHTAFPCSHLSDVLIVKDRRFGPVRCANCGELVSNTDLLARKIDPNRPHGDHPPEDAYAKYDPSWMCRCERCVEVETAADRAVTP